MIFVTGGTGLVGSHLLFELAQKGGAIRALKRRESDILSVEQLFCHYSDQGKAYFRQIEWHEGDLLDAFSLAEAMKDVTEVYHCAAHISVDPKEGPALLRNNVSGTANLADLALENGVKKFCHVSSVAALGRGKGGLIDEGVEWDVEGSSAAYSLSKYLSEMEVWRASQEGLPVVVVNPSIVLGPGRWDRGSGLLFTAAARGFPFYSGGGMGFVDVRDVAKSMVRLMEGGAMNQRFIISAQNISYKDLAALLSKALGKSAPHWRAGRLLLNLAWRVEALKCFLTGSAPLLTREAARHAGTTLTYNGEKLKRAIGNSYISIDQSVKDTAGCYLSGLKQAGN